MQVKPEQAAVAVSGWLCNLFISAAIFGGLSVVRIEKHLQEAATMLLRFGGLLYGFVLFIYAIVPGNDVILNDLERVTHSVSGIGRPEFFKPEKYR